VGFLLSRRWLVFAVVVAALAWVAVELGQWQFHRLDERKAENQVTATNLDAVPVPVDDVLSPDRPAGAKDEWRRVTAHEG
jgi:cytochrome oxidase assembly protein ShyY1